MFYINDQIQTSALTQEAKRPLESAFKILRENDFQPRTLLPRQELLIKCQERTEMFQTHRIKKSAPLAYLKEK